MMFNTGNSSNPTISSIASDRLSLVLNSNVTIDANTKLLFVVFVDPGILSLLQKPWVFMMMRSSTFSEDTTSDAS